MNVFSIATFVAALACALPVSGAEYFCEVTGGIRWDTAEPTVLFYQPGEGDILGQGDLFRVDTTTGDWSQSTPGSRALITGGGTYRILSDGTGYRQNWTGQVEGGGAESLRLDLSGKPIRFLRTGRDGYIEFGTCADTNDGRFP